MVSPNHLSTSGLGHFTLFSFSFLNVVFPPHNQSLNKDGNIRNTDGTHVNAEHKNDKKEFKQFASLIFTRIHKLHIIDQNYDMTSEDIAITKNQY